MGEPPPPHNYAMTLAGAVPLQRLDQKSRSLCSHLSSHCLTGWRDLQPLLWIQGIPQWFCPHVAGRKKSLSSQEKKKKSLLLDCKLFLQTTSEYNDRRTGQDN